MSLKYAHEGYEYQDLLSAYYILREIINRNNCQFYIDIKEINEDKFDDLTINTDNKIIKNQIKYSNEEVDYTLQKSDLSASGSHDLPLDSLFKTWNNYATEKKLELRLELAWNEPQGELLDILKVYANDIKKSFKNTKLYKINLEILWPENEPPIRSWRRFKKESENIDRNLFEKFCENLIIEVNMPKASLNISSPGELELYVIGLIKKIGIGKYPNNHIGIEEAILHLLHKIKNARAKEIKLDTNDILSVLRLNTNYGSIHQEFDIDKKINVVQEEIFNEYRKKLNSNNKIVVFGEPGAGKSWFIQNLINYLENENLKVIKHYCYVGLEDENAVDRIKTDVFHGNLVKDLLTHYPKLNDIKPTIFGSDFSELQALIKSIPDQLILIVDGLDHIERVFDLNSHSISKDEINILDDLIKLELPSNIKLIIASQPLEREIFERENFLIENLPKCNERFISILLGKYKIKDIEFQDNTTLIEEILKKSQGNALYISYLIKEIKNLKIVTKDSISRLPNYTFNLSEYYKYLMTKLSKRDQIVYTLCGVSFPLNRKEIQEITEYGDLLEGSLKILEPVLKENYSNGGIVLYHESFRRYIIDYLKNKKMNIKRWVFRDLLDWFGSKDFFSNIKSYRYYLSVLFDAGEYDEILRHLNKGFIIDSLFYAHSKILIIRNYKFFLKAAVKKRDYKSIIIISELGRILSSSEDNFEDIQDLYFKAMGDINGYEYLKELLVYENEVNLTYISGLKICYLCSKNKVIPNWDIYLNLSDAHEIEINEYKFYIRGWLDLNDISKIKAEIIETSNDKYLEFSKIIENEYTSYYGKEACKNLFLQLVPEFWKGKIENNQKKVMKFEDIDRSIMDIEHIDDKEILLLKNVFLQIDYFIKSDISKVNLFIKEISNRNWFYNWIIFVIEIKKLKKLIPNENDVVNIYKYLVEILEPFMGRPRTCDLYSLEPAIYKSIIEPLKFISSKACWEEVLNILKDMSIETTTHIQGSIGGPLDTSKFMKLLEEISNEENIDLVIKLFENLVENEESYRFYEYTTKNKLILASIYSKAKNKEKAKKTFKEALKYHTAYTFRKDRTLSELIESILSVNSLDINLGEKYIKELRVLTDAVVKHTDGKSTRYYPIEWYEEFVKINLKNSIVYIKNELLKCKINWVLEDSLLVLLENLKSKPIIVSFILKSYPNNIEKKFLNIYMDNIEALYLTKNKELTRISFNDFITRFFNNDKVNYDETIDCFISKMSMKLRIDKVNVNYKTYKTNEGWDTKEDENIIERKNYGSMSLTEITKYFSSNHLIKNDINSLIYYFEQLKTFNSDVKIFIDILITPPKYSSKRWDHFRNLKKVFQNMDVKDDMLSYAKSSLFCVKEDGWYKKFVEIDLFADSYKKDENIAEEAFFKNIYTILESPQYSSGISANIINSLVKSKYDEEKIKEIWNTLYDIIDSRLPGKVEYDWNTALSNEFCMNTEELLICILLLRMKSGEVERQKWVLSGMKFLLENNKKSTIKPLKWFFKNKQEFIEVSFLLVLQIVWEFSTEYDIEFKENFKTELNKIYPTENFMINLMIEDLLDIVRTSIIPLRLPTSISKVDRESLKKFIRKSARNKFLNSYKFDLSEAASGFYSEIRGKNFGQRIMELYGNRIHEVIIKNISIDNVMQKYTNLYLQDWFNENSILGYFTKRELFYNINYDLKTLIAQQNSLVNRPNDLELPSSKGVVDGGFSHFNINAEWIRIGCLEVENKIDRFGKNTENKIVFQGMVFTEKKLNFPFHEKIFDAKLLWENFWYYKNLTQIKGPIVMCNLNSSNDGIERSKIIWLLPELMSTLKLELKNAEYGLVGQNEEEEIVLKYERWDTDFIDYNKFDSEIPQLSGGQLLIRRDYFLKICNLSEFKPKLFNIKW